MSTNRGTSQDKRDSAIDTSSCLIPCPSGAPEDQFPFWKATASRDGSRLAIPMQVSPEECRLYTWALGNPTPTVSEPFLSITDLRALSDREFSFLCQTDEGWSAVIGENPWQFHVEFAWNLNVSEQGVTACETQDQRRYTPVVGTTPWADSYENTFGLTLSASGDRSAAVVQTTPIAEGDLAAFLSGCFTLASDRGPWSGRYIGAFTPALSADGSLAAMDARISQYEYSIVVNDRCWPTAWTSVWAPVIHPEGSSVWAPVKEPRGWTLACDGEIAWPRHYIQLWEPAFSPRGHHIAAVASLEFGSWTLALDGVPWRTRVDGYLSKPVFSPCGSRIGCTGAHKGKAVVLIDDQLLDGGFDKAWAPVFSPYGSHAAVKVRKGSRFSVLLDGTELDRHFLWMTEPAFTPDGKHLRLCGIEKDGSHYRYTRECIPID